jgi:hypothetical protein
MRQTIQQLKIRSQTVLFSGALAASVVFLLHVLIEFSWSFQLFPLFFSPWLD